MRAYQPTALDRMRAAIPVALIHGSLLFVLLQTQDSLSSALPDRLKLMDLTQVPPPKDLPPPPPAVAGKTDAKRREAPRPEGAASPPNIESRATAIVAPEPMIPPLLPTPITAAPIAGTGSDRSTGAAPIHGRGTGSGGIGNGNGSGGFGTGPGGSGEGGTGDGEHSAPRKIRGSIRDGDYPAAAAEAGLEGSVGVIYDIEVNGRVSNCRITRSSGSPLLDQATCRIMVERYRFVPELDPRGRPLRSQMTETQHWHIRDLPPEREVGRRRIW